MKRKKFNEQDYVVTGVMGREREHVKEMMICVFMALIERGDDGSGFPIWGESRSKLMEVAYALAKWGIVIHHPTGGPASMREIAGMLCRSLHCSVPRNIYNPIYLMRKRKRCVVDYYAKLWREGRVTPASSLLWAEPVYFPKIHNYKEAFDSPYFRRLHMKTAD